MAVAPLRRRCLSLALLATLAACSALPREQQGAQAEQARIALALFDAPDR